MELGNTILKCPVLVYACSSNNVETKHREVTVMLPGTPKTNRKVGIKNMKIWKCFQFQSLLGKRKKRRTTFLQQYVSDSTKYLSI